MIRRLSRSLSFRLLAIFLIMGVLFAYGAILGIRWVYATDDLRELVSGHLSLHIDLVKKDIGNPPNINNALAITRKVPVDIRITGPDLDWASDSAFPALDDLTFGTSDTFSEQAEAWLSGIQDIEYATYKSHGYLKINQGPYAIIVSSPKIADSAEERQLTPIIIGFGLFLVLLAYMAVRWLVKPIAAISRGAAQIGRGNFAHRITGIRKDQLGDLAVDINKMADDVQGMLDAKRQLLLGVSHELRSPLSRMRLALELADDPSIKSELDIDITEMEKIIATLLEAERLSGRHAAINISRVSARQLVEQLVADFFSRDADRIELHVADDVLMNVDEARITLLLKNLLSNSLRYTRPQDGKIEVVIDQDHSAWRLSVRDRGPGIAANQLNSIGQPFHRGDPSRTRATGGSGLGLYLARMIAEAHGGKLSYDESYTAGACFVVTLPFEPGEED